MPLVSILIPAFKPEFLDLSIASALSQTCPDFELIVSDDSSGPDIESIVSKWSDPRIRYVKNPDRARPGTNRDHLVSLASGRYLKFLHDDDFLFPANLERLTSTAKALGASLVYSWWYVIDAAGRPRASYTPVPAKSQQLLSKEEFFEEVVAQTVNFIGGPSHVLIEADSLRSVSDPFGLDGIRMRFMTDIALFTNLFHRGLKVAGVGSYGSVYRQHEAQYSKPDNTAFAAVLFEWELFQRWSADHGYLSPARYAEVSAARQALYVFHSGRYPELAPFIELGGHPGGDGRYLSEAFLAVLHAAHRQIDERLSLVSVPDGGPKVPDESGATDQRQKRLEERLVQAELEASNCQGELDALRRTRTFRYTAQLRQRYAGLRTRTGLN
jgi:glycosyltransferase involved in cell wall biosynthesis